MGKLGFTYGKFEARLRMPEGKQLWPALWMLPKDFVYGNTFAASGEIDIMELRGDK
jgi:beta-glucanase (GH16 family)